MRGFLKIICWAVFLGTAFGAVGCTSGANRNGTRDDIDRWIEKHDGNSKKTRAVLQQAARDYQAVLTNANDREKSIAAMKQLIRTQSCSWYVFKRIDNPILDQLEAEILNTEERSRAWIRANKNMVAVPLDDDPESKWKGQCKFNPDQMEN